MSRIAVSAAQIVRAASTLAVSRGGRLDLQNDFAASSKVAVGVCRLARQAGEAGIASEAEIT
jgi:hypothetical protein